MKIESIQVGILSTNCYVITDEATSVSAIFDPGGEYCEIENMVKDKNVKYIFITHGHYDHIFGTAETARQTGAKVVIGKNDEDHLYNTEKCNSGMNFPKKQEHTKADIVANEGDEFFVGNIKIKVLETPGHSLGSVCYILPDEKVIFSGDTLFYHSVGRIDFPTSAPSKMLKSLLKLVNLEGDYIVYPGHGRSTTLDEERNNNYFLR